MLTVSGSSIVSTLERLGWTRGPSLDNGVFCEHFKHFPGVPATASISYRDGLPVGYVQGWEDQELDVCCFEPGLNVPQDWAWYRQRKKIKLSTLDPVVISEVLSDLHTLAAKAK